MNRKIILLLIIAAVIFVSGCGSTKNDEDQAQLRSTKSDMEMTQQDMLDMLGEPPMDIQYFTNWIEKSFSNKEIITSRIFVTDYL